MTKYDKVKNECKKQIEFSAKVTACIIGHIFPLKTIKQPTLKFEESNVKQNFKAGLNVIRYSFQERGKWARL